MAEFTLPQYLSENPLTVSFSSTGTSEFCWRKFEFSKLFRNPKRYGFSLPGACGNAIHAAHQEFMRTQDEDAAIFKLMMEYPIEHNPELYDPLANRSLEACVATLIALMRSDALIKYQLAEVKCMDGEIRPAIEVPFDIVLKGIFIDGRQLVYTGFIDYIFFNVLSGEYTTADLKTTRDFKGNPIMKYEFHSQCLPYGLVLQHIAGEPIYSFQTLYLHTILDLLDARVSPIAFPKGESQIQDWYTWLVFWVKQFKEFRNADWFPRRRSGCENRFGSGCQYHDMCDNRDSQQIQRLLLVDDENFQEESRPTPWISFELEMPDALKEAA